MPLVEETIQRSCTLAGKLKNYAKQIVTFTMIMITYTAR